MGVDSPAPVFGLAEDPEQYVDAEDPLEIPIGTTVNIRISATQCRDGALEDRNIVLRIVPFMMNGEDVVMLDGGREKWLDGQHQLLLWSGSLDTTVLSLRGPSDTLNHTVAFCATCPGVVHFAAMASLAARGEGEGEGEGEEEEEELCWSSHPRRVKFL
jgi:hypothetical protein